MRNTFIVYRHGFIALYTRPRLLLVLSMGNPIFKHSEKQGSSTRKPKFCNILYLSIKLITLHESYNFVIVYANDQNKFDRSRLLSLTLKSNVNLKAESENKSEQVHY